MGLSLGGVRVLDLSRVLAGPFCAALLGDMGADVIKVEDTASGDEARTWPPFKDGESAAYLACNRNKRGMTLDLKALAGRDVLKRLVRQADVLVENFRTGTMEGFGLGYEALSSLNPRLIYCSISAFGRSGPLRERAGYEAHHQSRSPTRRSRPRWTSRSATCRGAACRTRPATSSIRPPRTAGSRR